MANKVTIKVEERVYSLKVKASNKESATTGRIIIDSRNYHRSIPAVVFTPEQAEELVDLLEGAYTVAVNE